MREKKVLIITYYWPPSGGSGVQRWLKFVKYLPSFGWKPYVFTPENPSFETKDESLVKDIPAEAEVIRFPIWEPYALFNKLSGKKKAGNFVPGKSKSSWKQKISIWIRGNFFIPDPRVFWVNPSVNFLVEYLMKNEITTVITTGPPHSVHLIGLKLKKKIPAIKWLADFRDPWSEWGFLDSLQVGSLARSFHRRLEKKVLTAADELITITPFYVRQFERLSGRKVNLLTNGFDESDFQGFVLKKNEQFLIRHVGVVNEKCDPRPLMEAVADFMKDHPELREKMKVEFVGSVHPAFQEFVMKNPVMASCTIFTAAVPHADLMEIYSSSAVLVLVLTGYKDAEGYMPGKLFEYLATTLPILGVGPVDGDASHVLKQTGAGQFFDGSNKQGIQQFLGTCYENWKNGKINPNATHADYTRKNIARALSDCLNRL